MAKKLVSAPPEALLQIAKSKGILSLLTLSEKTKVDRKTLRSINKGQSVKESTLQAIADNLRVPLTHLLGQDRIASLQLNSDGPSRRSYELELQPLNAIMLRKMLDHISMPDAIDWNLNINHVSDELETKLLKFETIVREWLLLINGWDHWKGKNCDLQGQLAKIKMTADIENHIQVLSGGNIKIFGATFIRWNVGDIRGIYGDFENAIEYHSICHGVIAVESKNATTSRINVDPGEVPPHSFENQPLHINDVFVDGHHVWSRSNTSSLDEDRIPNAD